MIDGKEKDEQKHTSIENDGQDPDEIVGPDGCDAMVMRTEFRSGDIEPSVEDSSFSVSDEIHESFPVEPIPVYIDPVDGLPMMAMPDPSMTEPVPFTYDNVICVEDEREYVEVFCEEHLARNGDSSQYRTPSEWIEISSRSGGDESYFVRSRFDKKGVERERERFKPEDVQTLWGNQVVRMPSPSNCDGQSNYGGDGAVVSRLVRPIRERCRYYKRQMMPNDDVPGQMSEGHRIIFRNCTMRRSNGGAFMSLMNEGVYACDYRDPFDAESMKKLDELDRDKLKNEPYKIRLPLFNLGE